MPIGNKTPFNDLQTPEDFPEMEVLLDVGEELDLEDAAEAAEAAQKNDCGKCDNLLKDQELHLQKKEDQDWKLKCELCVETFVVGSDLLEHLLYVHIENLKEGGKCDLTCQEQVKEKEEDTEVKSKEGGNTEEIKPATIKCEECNQEFKTRSALKSHSKTHMDQILNIKFKCDLCIRMFTTKQDKSLHQIMMHAKTARKGLNEKDKSKFQCDHCGWKHISK
jgi:ribosomal protein L31